MSATQPTSPLSRVRIVLVRPTGPANVGAACRAMANMGLSDLVLVDPKHPPTHPDAVAYATHGQHVLNAARLVDTIEEALAGCVRTFATSSKLGLYRRQAVIDPPAAAREALSALSGGPVAIAFGPERVGLLTRELLLFDRLLCIPADDAFPVLNLAAAVLVVCYELRRVWLEEQGGALLPQALDRDVAGDERKQALFTKLFDALERIRFFSTQNPDHLKYALRHVFGRLEMTTYEVDILIGMAQQIRWYADHHPDPANGAADEPGGHGPLGKP